MTTFFAFSGVTLLHFSVLDILKLLATLYSAVLFLQSGFDKVFDYAGNKGFINGLFEKTILRPFLPLLMPVITLLEVSAGVVSLVGLVVLLLSGQETLAVLGLVLGAKAILLLFMGLRIAKDYAGAAAITGYFVFYLAALALFIL